MTTWKTVKLDSVAKTMSGGTPSRTMEAYYSGNIPWVTTSELNDGYIYETKEYITEKAIETSSAKLFPAGTVLMAMYGATIGKLGILAIDATTNQACCAFFPQEKVLDSRYLYYVLLHNRKNFISLGIGAGQPNISQHIIQNTELLLPEIDEQTAIAAALSDTDALIESLEKLIAKKQAFKQGAMQELLAGKRRLKGFSGEWIYKKIKDIAPLQRGFDLPQSALQRGTIPVIFSNGINAYHNKAMAKGPGVITGRSGTIGKIHYIMEDYWPHNTALWVTDFCGNNPLFIYYLFHLVDWEKYMSGSGVPTLNRNDVHEQIMFIPIDIKEQAAIATVLSDMDDLIASFENKLDKVCRIKQGMMAELLTGRIRLKEV